MDLTSPLQALRSLARRQATDTDLAASKRLEKLLLGNNLAPQNSTVSEDENYIKSLSTLLTSDKWECIAAGFIVTQDLLKGDKLSPEDVTEIASIASMAVDTQLEHREPRVRASAVGVLGELARVDGEKTWTMFGKRLFDLVEKNFTLDEEERRAEYAQLASRAVQDPSDNPPEPPQKPVSDEAGSLTPPASPRLNSLRKPLIAHETMGWKALETSMKSLNALLEGFGPNFVSDGHLMELPLLDLVCEQAPSHENRYVREVGYFLCGTIADVLARAPGGVEKYQSAADRISEAISKGLCDNWSQVRYAASVAVRMLCLGLSDEQRTRYAAKFVPRMCLNRYYLAEGVRIYSQRTWELVYSEKGPQVVAKHAAEVVAYYVSQCGADNHGVREAACHSVAELSSQVDKQAIEPFVGDLLSALIQCFRDESWPVRDAACVACARFVKGFPEGSKVALDELYELWFNHLSDNIWSVREDSAVALGVVMEAYPDSAVEKVVAQLGDLLTKVKDEKPIESDKEEEEENNLPANDGDSVRSLREDLGAGVVAVTGSLLNLRKHNHDTRHKNQTMFSCGSLAPKLRRGVGCMDHGFSRSRQLWEYTDGGVYLLRELAKLHPGKAEAFMQLLADAARHTGFRNEWLLQETLWKQLPTIASSLGKRVFKRYMEHFLGPMIRALRSNHQLAAHAAGYCVRSLREMLGPEIFKGRVLQDMDGERMWQTIQNSPLVG